MIKKSNEMKSKEGIIVLLRGVALLAIVFLIRIRDLPEFNCDWLLIPILVFVFINLSCGTYAWSREAWSREAERGKENNE